MFYYCFCFCKAIWMKIIFSDMICGVAIMGQAENAKFITGSILLVNPRSRYWHETSLTVLNLRESPGHQFTKILFLILTFVLWWHRAGNPWPHRDSTWAWSHCPLAWRGRVHGDRIPSRTWRPVQRDALERWTRGLCAPRLGSFLLRRPWNSGDGSPRELDCRAPFGWASACRRRCAEPLLGHKNECK